MSEPLLDRVFILTTPYHAVANGSVVTLDGDDYIVHAIKRIILLDDPEPAVRIEARVRYRAKRGESL